MSGKIEVNQEELAKVFTEWERRYREEPERFQSEAVKLLRETPESYGEAAAPYFVFILNEMRANNSVQSDYLRAVAKSEGEIKPAANSH